MSSPSPESIDRLQEAFRTIMRTLGSQLAEPVAGLTGPQFYILHQLEQRQRCTVGELADSMNVKPSAITAMIDRLDKHGYVSRDRDEEDRRVVYISLLDHGKSILTKAKQNRLEALKQLFAHFTDEEWEQFVYMFEKLAVAAVQEARQKGVHSG
ncbi:MULTISPECIES: MarR family winged helix-turn-helix transcriptional regulator [Brevibacillus]|jgi:DNA-binding MarR family transcriptional regulator|uniref:MarR family transcriptional regulator n=1 Tax=Brevibacillus parabrevis TaxID=54914 RepID=A0A4Y3PTB4_BREPA|nr:MULTISPECIES: MarR family transcriptional regulator [Brevibacillus]TGV13662.1 MarR family transcriptional regulator [Mesorhizobium sp. M00.F.Ca.ET.186.01.1.1]KZE54670.1 MarR family transcriptional regulator [Brevibacillus parabrevis]MBU8713093.1 MarR family transcriptional regulator [Brevibacillus parabrevis]MDH6348617.1 DNA-binding MarR family transcriptional regulator [Brevibacillus sp. 1238]MDR5002238.1 MarR family transcriptional regulator [Brevibacillus parabrevis]